MIGGHPLRRMMAFQLPLLFLVIDATVLIPLARRVMSVPKVYQAG
jgi:hypothetical protein